MNEVVGVHGCAVRRMFSFLGPVTVTVRINRDHGSYTQAEKLVLFIPACRGSFSRHRTSRIVPGCIDLVPFSIQLHRVPCMVGAEGSFNGNPGGIAEQFVCFGIAVTDAVPEKEDIGAVHIKAFIVIGVMCQPVVQVQRRLPFGGCFAFIDDLLGSLFQRRMVPIILDSEFHVTESNHCPAAPDDQEYGIGPGAVEPVFDPGLPLQVVARMLGKIEISVGIPSFIGNPPVVLQFLRVRSARYRCRECQFLGWQFTAADGDIHARPD